MRDILDFTEEEKLKIIDDYTSRINKINKLAIIYNTGPKTITKILKEKNVKITIGKLPEKIKLSLIKEYPTNNKNLNYFSKKYKLSRSSVSQLLRKNGVKIRNERGKNRKIFFNQNYFSIIDTEAKAYFLGLMYADGSNHKKLGMCLCLQEQDKHILESLKKELGYKKRLKIRKCNKSIKLQYKLLLCSIRMVNDLINLGCSPNKTFTLKFPTEKQVPSNLIHHFIRGYLDGDGCICISNKSTGYLTYTCNIISTISFCQSFQEFLIEKLGLKSSVRILYPKTNKITSVIELHGLSKCQIFLDWLYKDATFFLKRKHKKYKIIKKSTYKRQK